MCAHFANRPTFKASCRAAKPLGREALPENLRSAKVGFEIFSGAFLSILNLANDAECKVRPRAFFPSVGGGRVPHGRQPLKGRQKCPFGALFDKGSRLALASSADLLKKSRAFFLQSNRGQL